MPKKKTANAPKAESLLVELLTEELPPKSLKRLSEAFEKRLYEFLSGAYLLTERSQSSVFATPRRLAVRFSKVLLRQRDRESTRRGPKESAPPQAVEGFARGLGVPASRLDIREGHYCYSVKVKGEPAAKLVPDLVCEAIKVLPISKAMRWGSGEEQFVRPVHGVILLHGNKVISGTVLGLKSSNKTLGHRFMSKGPIVIKRADDYEKVLENKGKVIADFVARCDEIVCQLSRSAYQVQRGTRFLKNDYQKKNGELLEFNEMFKVPKNQPHTNRLFSYALWMLQGNDDLLDEVTAIVEWPVVYIGEFEKEFLSLPAECISLSMQKNQKYFALVDETGALLPNYLVISNIETKTPEHVVGGNARVLRARLSDAKFFYEQDRKTRLEERVPRLANVVYHNKLGNQLERVQRLQKLAVAIANQLGLSAREIGYAERAAYLCKADLLTEMVGEFPELQGIMGRYYALRDGEPEEVADAIIGHYAPHYAGANLPDASVGFSMSLADKLDTLVGFFGIGLAPSGEKDPFGLRRAAVGALRILVEKKLPLDLKELIESARGLFTQAPMAPNVVQQVQEFIFDRLRSYLKDKGYAPDEIEAVLALKPTRLDQVPLRLDAIKKFRALPEGMALSAANKRIRNILRQAGGKVDGVVNSALLKEEAEKQLALAVQSAASEVMPMINGGDYNTALKRLAALRPAVDEFFDKVMVMADDPDVRSNRLALLNNLGDLFLHVADVSRLQG